MARTRLNTRIQALLDDHHPPRRREARARTVLRPVPSAAPGAHVALWCAPSRGPGRFTPEERANARSTTTSPTPPPPCNSALDDRARPLSPGALRRSLGAPSSGARNWSGGFGGGRRGDRRRRGGPRWLDEVCWCGLAGVGASGAARGRARRHAQDVQPAHDRAGGQVRGGRADRVPRRVAGTAGQPRVAHVAIISPGAGAAAGRRSPTSSTVPARRGLPCGSRGADRPDRAAPAANSRDLPAARPAPPCGPGPGSGSTTTARSPPAPSAPSRQSRGWS